MDLRILIQEALMGNMRAFDELYACSRQSVWFTCIKLLKNEQDAKDLMQETYLTAFSKLDTLKNPDAFIGWINRIAINSCKNHLRKNSDYTYDEMQDYADIPEVNEEFLPEEYVTNESKRKILLDIMQKSLSDVQYQTIILHYFNELSVAEIAELMECGEEAVKSRLRYARAKIKEEVLLYEKKNNDRLFVFVPALYLSRIFRSEADSSATPLINYAAKNLVQNSIITQAAAGQINAAAKTGGKAMLKVGKAKLIAGIAVGAVVVGGAIALVKFSGNGNDIDTSEVTTTGQTTNEVTKDALSEEPTSENEKPAESSGDRFWINNVQWGEAKPQPTGGLFTETAVLPLDLNNIDEMCSPYTWRDERDGLHDFTSMQEVFALNVPMESLNDGILTSSPQEHDSVKTQILYKDGKYLRNGGGGFDIGKPVDNIRYISFINLRDQNEEPHTAAECYEKGWWQVVLDQGAFLLDSAGGKAWCDELVEKLGKPTYIGYTDDRKYTDENLDARWYGLIWEYEDFTIVVWLGEAIYCKGTDAETYELGYNAGYYFPHEFWHTLKDEGRLEYELFEVE